MSDLTPEQRKVLSQIKSAPSYRRASPKARLALIEAALVESNLSTPDQGHSDRDSEGVLQQRPSQGWGPTSESNTQDAEQFLKRAIPLASKYKTAGQLAQAVQRSAYPGRYDQRRSLAMQLMGGGGGAPVANGPATSHADAALMGPTTVANPDAEKRVILANYLLRKHPNSLLLRLGVVSPTESTTQQVDVSSPPQASTQPGGAGARSNVRTGHGKGIGGPLLEDFYDPLGGIKNGKEIGAIGGHGDHVHVAAGRKSIVELGRRAQQMGLHVGENPAFGGVHPVHVKNSYHYKGEAIDVSGSPQKMASFYKLVKRLYGVA